MLAALATGQGRISSNGPIDGHRCSFPCRLSPDNPLSVPKYLDTLRIGNLTRHVDCDRTSLREFCGEV